MRKALIKGISLLIVMVLINGLLTLLLPFPFFDMTFFIGLFFLAFSGTHSFPGQNQKDFNYYDNQVLEQTGLNVDRNRRAFSVNFPFIVVLGYTLIGLIISIIHYFL